MNVTQVRTIDRSKLTDLVGQLSENRMKELAAGLALVFGTDDAAEPFA